ncbi:MAG: hypothetical protein R3281_04420 [Balneolaceae bacterium]|nr:hypothetical protein [Balneolaceae bacterium]
MDLIYKIETIVVDLIDVVLNYAEPYLLELIVFLLLGTFFFGFLFSSK